MTPEKFQLLRDWVRSEIRSVIIEENKGSTAAYWSETRDHKDAVRESDRAFMKVMSAFCGGPTLL
jgi:hypothetical protein|tara:strand:+ start:2086 stop:2280 length:195 start_codon:yes stop_codon:yes gene_type:complete